MRTPDAVRLSGGIAVVALLCTFATGCSKDSTTPVTPTPITSVAGTWTADLTVAGSGTRMTWTLSQNDAAVTGPVLIALPSGVVLMNGFLTGTVSGNTLTYTISVGPGGIPLQPSCAGQLGGTMSITVGAVSTLKGTPSVTSSTCTPPLPGGEITLTKQ